MADTKTQKFEVTGFKKVARTILMNVPFGKSFYDYLRYQKAQRQLRKASVADTNIFEHHFHNNFWDSEESVSGPGSTIAYTEQIRTSIPQLLQKLDAKTFLDAPCGDFNWGRLVDWGPGVSYLGGDIVAKVAEQNQERFGNEHRSFRQLDITSDPLPRVDLWMCRDCLFHLSTEDIWKVVRNFLKSDVKYLLTTSHATADSNGDIPTGAFRYLNLERPPFSFGPPSEKLKDWIDGYPERSLCLWSREELAQRLQNNKQYQRFLRK